MEIGSKDCLSTIPKRFFIACLKPFLGIAPGLLLLALVVTPSLIFAESRSAKIGIILPLSGEYAWIGAEVARGLELSLNDTSEVKLIIEDAATQTPAQVVSTARRLLTVDKVDVLSVLTIDDSEPLVPLVKGGGVPLLVLWESSERLVSLGGPLYSAGFSLDKTGEAFVRAASEGGLKRVALIGHLCPWAETMFKAFHEHGARYGLSIVAEEMLPMESREFRSVVARFKTKEPETVFIALALPSAIASFLKQSRELGLKTRFVTGEAFVGDGVRIAGTDAEGVIVPWPAPDDLENLDNAYRSRFKTSPSDLGAVHVGFSGGMALQSALRERGNNLIEKFDRFFGPSRALNRTQPLHRVASGKLTRITESGF